MAGITTPCTGARFKCRRDRTRGRIQRRLFGTTRISFWARRFAAAALETQRQSCHFVPMVGQEAAEWEWLRSRRNSLLNHEIFPVSREFWSSLRDVIGIGGGGGD